MEDGSPSRTWPGRLAVALIVAVLAGGAFLLSRADGSLPGVVSVV